MPHMTVSGLCVLANVVLVLGAERSLSAQAPFGEDVPRRACDLPRPLRLVPGDSIPHCIARVQVFGDANLKDVLGAKDAPAVASGALGLHYAGSRYIVTGLVNVAGTNDTVRANFGSSLLIPAAGQGLNAASLVVRRRAFDWGDTRCAGYVYNNLCNFGVRLAVSASTRRWATRAQLAPPSAGSIDSVVQVVEVTDVPILGAEAGLSYEFFDGALFSSDDMGRQVGMILDAAFTYRALRGDLSGGSPNREEQRQRMLGTTETNFRGWQVGLTLVYDQLRSTFTYYKLNGAVDGLTRGQIVAGVDLRAPIASGLLTRH